VYEALSYYAFRQPSCGPEDTHIDERERQRERQSAREREIERECERESSRAQERERARERESERARETFHANSGQCQARPLVAARTGAERLRS
jgi:hypothetical protein